MGMKENFSANIVVGDSFNFSFRNLDVVHTVKFQRRTSPSRSQRKRNQQQEIKFEKERMELYNDANEFIILTGFA